MTYTRTNTVNDMTAFNHDRRSKLGRALVLGLSMSLLGTLTVGGCASPDTIDRVQPNLIEKSSLEGEWYLLDTVVKAPFASGYAFKGYQSDLLRGVWEVEEDFLYFYRTYEFVDGSETQGIKADSDTPLLDEDGNPITVEKVLADGTTVTATRYVYRSSPLARYPITGHYDVRRSYNSLTGEESNVIVEDSSESFWWERKSMRVNFAQDTSGNFARLAGEFSLGSVYEGEVGPEEIQLRVEDDGTYMDFVVKNWLEAPSVYFYGYGYIPACLFFPWAFGRYFECDTEELQVRTAFMKVPTENSYTPMAYNDHMLSKFGYFRSERADYDTYYGITFSDAERQVQRHRIWEEYVDANGDGELDYDQMTPKPIVYYLTEDFPRELIPGAIDLADQWNEPFVEIVQAVKDPSFNGRMFVLCENTNAEAEAVRAADPNAPLASTDPTYCKDMDKPRYVGDLRYNHLASVNEPTQTGLYGYGPAHSDPLTGETVVAYAWQYTANIRLGARTAVDMIEYEAGVQNFRDITQAEHITTKVKAEALKNTQNSPRSYTIEDAQLAVMNTMSPDVAANLVDVGFAKTDLDLARSGMSRLGHDPTYDALLWRNADMAAMVGMPVDNLEDVQDSDGFLRSVVSPQAMATEDFLNWQHEQDVQLGQSAICMGHAFDDTFRGIGLEYKSEYDKAVCEGLADLPGLIFDFSSFNEPGASCDTNANACGADQICTPLAQGDVNGKFCITPCNTGALLDQLRKEIRRVNLIDSTVYWDPNALYTDVKDDQVRASQIAARDIIEGVREKVFLETFDRMWSTVALHEVGHNMGLRHNFASSTDALNYFPDYWNLKGFVGQDGQYHPKNLWQRDTSDQVVSRIREYQQSSVMEYGSGFNARYQGLGAYDHAAIHFGYSGLLHVFAEAPDLEALEADGYLAEPEDTDPTNYPVTNVSRELPLARAFRKIHHTNYPNVFGSVEAMQQRKLVKWQDLIRIENGEPVECSLFDHPYQSDTCGMAGSFCQAFPTGFFCTKPNMVEVPFRFCSDEYNWRSPTCQTRDEGTDSFEIVANSIDDYEDYWAFYGYKRDSDTWAPQSSYWGAVMSYAQGWRKHFEHWAYNYVRYNKGDWWEKQFGVAWHMDVNGGLGDTLAAQELFQHMANIFGRPSDGYYGWNDAAKQYEPAINNGKNTYCNFRQIREDSGARPMYPGYDYSGYIYTPVRGGAFYDRLAALMMMTYPQMIFVRGSDTQYDIQRFRLNFSDVWPQRMQNLLSSMITSEPVGMGWCIEHDGKSPSETNGCGDSATGAPIGLKPRLWFGTDAELDAYYANCEPLQPEPEYSFPTTQYRLPALAMVYGIGWMSQNFDRTFVDRTRLWLEGDGSDVTLSPNFDVIDYIDPLSGKTYQASYDPTEFDPAARPTARDMVPRADVEGHGHVYWPAARLVQLANNDLAKLGGNLNNYYNSELQQLVGRLEILRGLYRRMDFGF